MGSRVARFAPLLVVAALGAASCGGGDSAPLTGATTDSTASSIDSPVVNDAGVIADELTSGILEAVGVDSAFAAVLYALDAGYSVGQLADAARDGTITPTGTIDGIEPAGPPLGLITPPAGPTGFAWRALARPATPDETGGPRTPEQVQAAIDRKLLTAVTRQALEEPWMLIPETDVADEFPAGPNPSVEATKVMITAIVSLIDVGYSFDQALNGWLFGEWDVGMGVLPDGTVLNGCIGIRAPDGSLVRPAAAMVNGMRLGDDPALRCGAAAGRRRVRPRRDRRLGVRRRSGRRLRRRRQRDRR